jgi:hypothetical protein
VLEEADGGCMNASSRGWLHGAVAALLVAGVAALSAPAQEGAPQESAPRPFSSGLFGDLAYAPAQEPLLDDVLADLNRPPLAFVVHVGDLGSPRAKADDSRAVMILEQGNIFPDFLPFPGDPKQEPSGFAELRAALAQEAAAFGRPVVLVHGGSHYFRVDKPYMRLRRSPDEPAIENFTPWRPSARPIIGSRPRSTRPTRTYSRFAHASWRRTCSRGDSRRGARGTGADGSTAR